MLKILQPKKRLLRAYNDNGPMVEISGHRNSFTSRATNLSKEQLTKIISQLNKENTFTSETKKYFYDRALARFTKIYHYHFTPCIYLSLFLGTWSYFDALQYLILMSCMYVFYIANFVVFNHYLKPQFSAIFAQLISVQFSALF